MPEKPEKIESNAAPETQDLEKYKAAQDIYRRYLESLSFDTFKSRQESLKIPLAPETIQDVFDYFLDNELFAYVRALADYLKIPPKFSQQIVERLFIKYASGDYGIHNLEALKDIVGDLKIDPEVSNDQYRILIQAGYISILEKVVKISGVPFTLKQEFIERITRDLIARARIDDLKILKDLSQVDLDPQIVREGYMDFIKSGTIDLIIKLEKISGIKPEFKLFKLEDIYSGYKNLMQKGDITALRTLNKYVNTPIPVGLIYKGYIDLLNCHNISAIESLRHFTGVALKFSESEIQKEYSRLANRITVHDLKKLKDLTGVPVDLPKELVQETYKKFFINNIPDRFEILKQLTGIEPAVDQKHIDELFKNNFLNHGPITSIKDWVKLGIAPSASMLQQVYGELIRLQYITNLGILKNLTGLEIQITPSLKDEIQTAYKNFIKADRTADCLKLKKITGVDYTINAESISLIYKNISKFFMNVRSFVRSLKDLVELTGIAIKPEVVQNIYQDLIKRHDLRDIKELFDLTKIPPEFNDDSVQGSYNIASQQGSLSSFKILFDLTKIPPDEKFVNEGLFNFLCQNHDISEVQKDLDKMGISLALTPDFLANSLKRYWKSSMFESGSIEKIVSRLSGLPINWSIINPNIDPEVYESARKISNKDLLIKTWEMLLRAPNDIELSVTQSKLGVRLKYIPPHLKGILLSSWGDNAIGLEPFAANLNIIFEGSVYKKKGARELANRTEFALINILNQAKPDELKVLFIDFQRIIKSRVNPGDMAKMLDIVATTIIFRANFNEESFLDSDAFDIKPPSLTAPSEILNFEDYVAWLAGQRGEFLGKVLGFSPNREDLERLLASWGDLRPLYILAGKYTAEYSEGMPLFTETAKAIFEERWHGFRYESSEAKALLAGLANKENEWIENLPSTPLEEVRVHEQEAEQKSQEIKEILFAGLNQGHFYSFQNRETSWAAKAYEWLRGILNGEAGFNLNAMKEARTVVGLELYRRSQLPGILKEFSLSMGDLEERLSDFSHILSGKIGTLQKNLELKESAKTRSALLRLLAAKAWVDDMKKIGSKAKEYASRLGILPHSDIKEVAELRMSFNLGESVARLSALSPEEIRANALRDDKGELKRGALIEWLKRLSAELRDRRSALYGDMENIIAKLSASAETKPIRGLVIQESDDPKALFETGKYPLGSGSCQNYEGYVDNNKCLMAYVADADKKIFNIKKPDDTIVARAIVKLVWIENEPALFIEPTYTSVNKKDHNFDPDFDKYIKEKAVKMGGAKVLRGAMNGPIRVKVRSSRNVYQYEDGGSEGVDDAGLGVLEGEYEMSAYEVGVHDPKDF